MGRLIAWVLSLAALLGCAPPLQQGGVIVLPGATERLILAMREGYAGVGEVKPPATVRTISLAEDLIDGPAASGKPGDQRLENQSVAAVVAQIGGERGGNLIDLASKHGGHLDELGTLETLVGGSEVHYETLKTGTDEATKAAFVQVTGHVKDRPQLLVSTRYDIAPELDTVLVHTSITVPDDLGGTVVLGDVLTMPGQATWTEKPGFVGALGKSAGYALKPLVDPDTIPTSALVSETTPTRATIGIAPATLTPGLFVYSRMIAPLDRPDTLALASALAALEGQELGEVELSLNPQSFGWRRSFSAGKFLFANEKGSADPLELLTERAMKLGDIQSAKIPAGAYRVTFESAGFRSQSPQTFHVRSKQLATASLDASPVSSAPSD